MKKDDVEKLAHRIAWRYRKSSDPQYSDTYTFNAATLHKFVWEVVSAEREACAKVCITAFYGISEFNTEEVKNAARNVCENLAIHILSRQEP